MLKKVKNFIEQHHMIEAGEKILAGVSGGADSVCLLLVLAKLQEPLGFTLAAVHVEHGIRGEESLADAAFTERLCRDLGIPCRRYSVRAAEYARERGLSLEEAARELRYGCFRQACREEGAGKAAVAHHGGDSAETMLVHLARGTGIRGLGGIAPSIQMDGMQVIRPLLCLTRQEIEGWLREQEQDFCVDATNADVNYARNRIRREVLPGLCRINSQAIAHMMNTAGQLREISEFLEEAAQQAGAGVYEKIAAESTAAGRIRIGEERFRQIHPVLQKTLLHQLIGEMAGGRKDITSGHVEQVLGLFGRRNGKQVCLPCGVAAERTRQAVELFFPGREEDPGEEKERICQALAVPGETLCANGMQFRAEVFVFDGNFEKIPQKRYTKWFDYDKIKNTVWLRNRQAGDFLQSDKNGGHKKLKRYLMDEKIPAEERDQILLLAEESHVLWVVGYRISEAYKISPGTKRVLCVRCVKESELCIQKKR